MSRKDLQDTQNPNMGFFVFIILYYVSMSFLRNSILATIVYYDIFDFPLTMFEVHKYLINPERLFVDPVLGIISLGRIAKDLEDLVKDDLVGSKNGFYFLSGRDALYELRIDREKIAAQKWKKFLRIAKWFQVVPYLRAILASGSLAINNTDKESDFDVLSVVKSGRLYTCRIFLCLVASFFRARRTRFDLVAPDKFCFNHYITDRDSRLRTETFSEHGNMSIKHESMFNAQTYVNLKPVLARNGIFSRFYAENIWLNKYVYNFKPASALTPTRHLPSAWQSQMPSRCEGEEFVLRSVVPNSILVGVGKLGEFILNSPLGNKIEDWAKKYQQKRIKENPATYESGGRVVFNDNELEFHPRSFEAFAIDRYNKKLKQLGIIPRIEEKDSGLNV